MDRVKAQREHSRVNPSKCTTGSLYQTTHAQNNTKGSIHTLHKIHKRVRSGQPIQTYKRVNQEKTTLTIRQSTFTAWHNASNYLTLACAAGVKCMINLSGVVIVVVQSRDEIARSLHTNFTKQSISTDLALSMTGSLSHIQSLISLNKE